MTWELKQKVKRLEGQIADLAELSKISAARILEQGQQIDCLRGDVKMLLERNGLVSSMFLVPRE